MTGVCCVYPKMEVLDRNHIMNEQSYIFKSIQYFPTPRPVVTVAVYLALIVFAHYR